MAGFAGGRRRLIEENEIAPHHLLKRMARRACNVLMSPLERKEGFVVVEEGRPPLVRIVTTGAVRSSDAKLVSVRILVAIAAMRGRVRKVDILHRRSSRRTPMTFRARDSAMRAEQWKIRLAVIEFRKILPAIG